MNGSEPATRADIAKLDLKIDQKIDELRAETNQRYDQLRGEMSHQYHDLVERIDEAQTQLLKAFYSFGQTNSKRMTELEGNEAAIRSRLATLEDRVLEVEKRLNIPPAA